MKHLLLLSSLLLIGCGVDIEETAQQIGDVMASIDESGGSGGSIAANERKPLERVIRPTPWEYINEQFVPSAYATSCLLASTYGSCSSNTRVRTFGGCTIGMASLEGLVTLAWTTSNSDCTMAAAGDSVSRTPAFTLTGRRGATLTVSKTGVNGQTITWASGSGDSRVFHFSNDGIRRVIATAAGKSLFDFTTETTSDINISGATRASRVLSGGALRVTDNLSAVYCDFVPTDVTWAATCNCPVSGSWSGTCSNSKSTALTITGCGTASFTVGTSTQSLTFDRCYGVN